MRWTKERILEIGNELVRQAEKGDIDHVREYIESIGLKYRGWYVLMENWPDLRRLHEEARNIIESKIQKVKLKIHVNDIDSITLKTDSRVADWMAKGEKNATQKILGDLASQVRQARLEIKEARDNAKASEAQVRSEADGNRQDQVSV